MTRDALADRLAEVFKENDEDAVDTIMSSMERASVAIEGASEKRLSGWLRMLEEAVKRRHMGV